MTPRQLLAAMAIAMLPTGAIAAAPANVPPSSGPAVPVARGPAVFLERGKSVLVNLRRNSAAIFIADPSIADVQSHDGRNLVLIGKASGETMIHATDAGGTVLYSAAVHVLPAVEGLRSAFRKLMPGEAIAVDEVGGAIALSGLVTSPAAAADAVKIAAQFADGKGGAGIINRLRIAAPQQVQLRVRVAEVDRSVLKQFGINWEAVLSGGSFQVSTYNPTTTGDVSGNNVLIAKFGDLTARLDALARDGFVSLLAQPNLTAQSGQTASFLAGGEFPIPIAVTRESGVANLSIEFKKFGVSLDFTPTVLDSGSINLRVRPEVSQLSSNGAIETQGIRVPALSVRRAETTVELGSGQSFVIAGLLQRSSEQSVSKVPGLGDIPVLGALFRSVRYRRAETELVIVVTPYLVRPVSQPTAVMTPTEGLVQPGDAAMLLAGRLHQPTPKTGD